MFVAYYYDGCSMAPLTQYKNNEIKQELTKEKDYFSSKSDERLYIDTKYINFYEIIKAKSTKYPFAIFNTDRENKPETHWWSFFYIYPRRDLLLFDSFGFTGFKKFIIDNDLSII